MSLIAKKYWMTVAAVTSFGMCVGCGQAEFERRLDKQVKAMSEGSSFAQDMQTPFAIPDTSVLVRIPKTLDSAPLTGVDEMRLKPSSFDITGLKLTYEGTVVDASGGKQPYYLYLGVADMASVTGGFDRASNLIRNKLQGSFVGEKGTTGQWTSVSCETPEGRMLEWKKLRATGKQDFYYVDANGQGSFLEMDGTLEVYLREQGEYLVTIAWRMPTIIEESVKLYQISSKVAGSIAIEGDM